MNNIFEMSTRYRAEQPRAAAVVDAMQIVQAARTLALQELPPLTKTALWREIYAQITNGPSPFEQMGTQRLERIQRYLREEYAEAIRLEPMPVASWTTRLEMGLAYGE